jgi:formiminotetrahydrofolate cyclodeaminase
MSSLWNEKLAAFREQVASATPTPGGGSVALVSAVLGCGLLIMATEISLARPEAEKGLEKGLERLREYKEKLSEHADNDVSVYAEYTAARKLPKETQTELAERDARLAEALNHAAEAPVAASKDIIATLEVAEEIAPLVHTGILSDVGAGSALLQGALEASLYTLHANIRGMKTVHEKEKYAHILSSLAKQSEERGNAIARIVNSRLA